MTDGERKEVIAHIRKAEEGHAAVKSKDGATQEELCELLRNILNICKRLAGDQAPLVE